MTFDQLMLLPEHDIDFGSLGSSLLLELAVQKDEPFIATSALGELGSRRAPEARTAAETVLANVPWDVYLHAFALKVLCGFDRPRATEVMRVILETSGDPKLLAAMMECCLSDVEYFKGEALRVFIEKVVERVKAVAPEEFRDPDERASFLEIFGQRRDD